MFGRYGGLQGQRQTIRTDTETQIHIPRKQALEIVKTLLLQSSLAFVWLQLIGPDAAAVACMGITGFVAISAFIAAKHARIARRKFALVALCALMCMLFVAVISTSAQWWRVWVFPRYSLATDSSGNVWLQSHIVALRIVRNARMWRTMLRWRDWIRAIAIIVLPLCIGALVFLELNMLRELMENPATQQQSPWQLGPLHWLQSLFKGHAKREQVWLDSQYGYSDENNSAGKTVYQVNYIVPNENAGHYESSGVYNATDEQWIQVKLLALSGASLAISELEALPEFTKREAREFSQAIRDRTETDSKGRRVATEEFKEFLRNDAWRS